MQHFSMTTLDYACNGCCGCVSNSLTRNLIMSSKRAHHNADAVTVVGLQRLYAPSVTLGPRSCWRTSTDCFNPHSPPRLPSYPLGEELLHHFFSRSLFSSVFVFPGHHITGLMCDCIQ